MSGYVREPVSLRRPVPQPPLQFIPALRLPPGRRALAKDEAFEVAHLADERAEEQRRDSRPTGQAEERPALPLLQSDSSPLLFHEEHVAVDLDHAVNVSRPDLAREALDEVVPVGELLVIAALNLAFVPEVA